MKADFDNAAPNYDATFTKTVIGRIQRDLVYDHLSLLLKENVPEKILEINCGTGEDAIWFAKQGCEVVATDISARMIEVASSKSKLGNIRFLQADINKINVDFEHHSFDLIFSNFGGLNCLAPAEVSAFIKNATVVLKPKERLALVIMPKNTLWEQLYFLLKLDFKNSFRRKKEYAIANVDGEKVKTYYYNPKDIVNLANVNFDLLRLKPIGFFIPPSYLNPFFKNKPQLVSLLKSLEKRMTNVSMLAKYADHYLIVLEKR